MDLITYSPLTGSFEQITVDGTVKTFTASKYAYRGTTGASANRPRTAQVARVTVETAGIRYTVDGTNPTTLIGHLVAAGTTFDIEGYDAIKAFKVTQAAGAAQISVTYFGN